MRLTIFAHNYLLSIKHTHTHTRYPSKCCLCYHFQARYTYTCTFYNDSSCFSNLCLHTAYVNTHVHVGKHSKASIVCYCITYTQIHLFFCNLFLIVCGSCFLSWKLFATSHIHHTVILLQHVCQHNLYST